MSLGCVVEPINVHSEDYIQTVQGSKYSEDADFFGSPNINLAGKIIIEHDVVLRGDLAKIKVGKNCIIRSNCVIRPPSKKQKGVLSFFPVQIGSHSYIDSGSLLSLVLRRFFVQSGTDLRCAGLPGTVVEAVKIGSFVHIGKNCIIGKRSIISDCCKIEEGTVVPPDSILAPFSCYAGVPGVLREEVSDSFENAMVQMTRDHYFLFRPSQAPPPG